MIKRPDEMTMQVRENMRGGVGPITFQHYFDKEEMTANTRLCAKLVIHPGDGIGTHPHEKEDEVYIITSGTGLVDDGTSETRVNAGDAVLTGKGEAHAIRNDGTEDLEFIAMIMCY